MVSRVVLTTDETGKNCPKHEMDVTSNAWVITINTFTWLHVECSGISIVAIGIVWLAIAFHVLSKYQKGIAIMHCISSPTEKKKSTEVNFYYFSYFYVF